MNTSKINVLLLATGSLLLAACGGGGGSDVDASGGNPTNTLAASSEPTDTTTVAPVSQAAINNTEDLVVTETFLFSSNYRVDVVVNLPVNYGHLTVCYAGNDLDNADYGNCLLRADLNSGTYNGELLLTNDTSNLVVSAWDFSDTDNPAVTYWDREVDGDLISVN